MEGVNPNSVDSYHKALFKNNQDIKMECEGNRHISSILDFEFDSENYNYNLAKEKISRHCKQKKKCEINGISHDTVKLVWICAENSLLPRTTYYWNNLRSVREMIKHFFDKNFIYSSVSSFTTSLWDGWGEAEAIYSSQQNSFAFLRSSLSVPIPDSCNVNTANLYVTAAETPKLTSAYLLNIKFILFVILIVSLIIFTYKLYLNEIWLGSGPGRNNAQNIQQFDSFNVLEIIQNASLNNNAIPIALAAECYHQTQGAFQLSLDIQFLCPNSSVSNYTIFSSPNWKSFSADSIFNPSGSSGPTYTQPHDAKRNINGSNWIDDWKSFNFDDSKWEQATTVTPFSTLVAKPTLPIAVSIAPVVYLTEVSSGHYFFYLEKEVMGGIMLNAINTENLPVQIEIRLGEELSGPNTVKYEMRTGNTYQDFWTLKPGQNNLEHHEYMEFRYGEILNFPGTLQAENLNVWIYNYPFDDSLSSFTSSSPELNAIYELCKYTVKATSLDVFTDSNTRERQPYEADAYITALSLLSVAPSYSLVRESFEMVTAFSTWPTEWHLITIQAAYLDYMTTGDLTIANNFWSTLVNNSFVPQYFNSSLGLVDKPPNLANGIKDIVDWPLPLRDGYIFTNVNTVINSFVYCASVILSELAQLTNNTNDAKNFQNVASQIWKTANVKLVDDNGIFLDGLNVNHTAAHGSAFGLAFGLVDSSRYDSVIKFLAAKGMVGSPYYAHYLFEGLYKTFSSEASTLAYSLMISNDYNSWLYMLSQNATMTTEMWNITEKPNMSWSHPWSTTPLSTITRYLMGITPTSPSFSSVSIRPQPPLLLSSPFNASIVFPTIKGPISVSIVTSTNDSGKYSGADLSIVLPANVIASVYLPTGANLLSKKYKKINVLVDGKEIEANREGEFVKIDNIGAGLHVFSITV